MGNEYAQGDIFAAHIRVEGAARVEPDLLMLHDVAMPARPHHNGLAHHDARGRGAAKGLLRCDVVDSIDLSPGPDPAKVGASMDELIGTVSVSAARATIRKGADDVGARLRPGA